LLLHSCPTRRSSDLVVGKTFGFPMGGAGLGAALVAHQTGVDEFHFVGARRGGAVAVGLAEPDAVDAQQGVRLGLYPVQSQFRVRSEEHTSELQSREN